MALIQTLNSWKVRKPELTGSQSFGEDKTAKGQSHTITFRSGGVGVVMFLKFSRYPMSHTA